jgi:hypothetical protein
LLTLPEGVVDERAAAVFLHVSIKTLQGWRARRTGPKYYKISNRVRYSLDHLQEYLRQCAVEPQG